MGGRDLAVVPSSSCRELTDTNLFLVLTCGKAKPHSSHPHQTLAAIARTSGSQTLHLRGLTNSEVRALWS